MSAQPKDFLMDQLLQCRSWIEDALAYSGDTHDFKDIVDGVLSGHMQLWVGKEGCAITEIVRFPKKKVLHVFLAAGEMGQIVDFQDSAVQFAKQNGCDALTLAGRTGWKRVLKDHGWKEQHVALIKEFES